MAEVNNNVLAISLNQLEIAARDNALLMNEWGQELAKAKRKAAEQKNRIKLVYARLDSAIRLEARQMDQKMTDKAVESSVLESQEYQAEQQALVDAEYDEERIQQMCYAVMQRGEQIGNLCKLHGQMYWSKPDTSGYTTPASREAVMDKTGVDLAAPPKDLGKKVNEIARKGVRNK